MIIEWKKEQVVVRAADDFKGFKIVVDASESRFAAVAPGFEGLARFDDSRTAWVAPGALRAAAGRGHDAEWQEALERMIEKARPHGWIDPATGDIRAHVEWADEGPAGPAG
jgi:hypothetical protein